MRSAPDRIETTRLICERLREQHLADLDRLHTDPRAMATLGGVRSRAETSGYLADSLAHWERFGFGLYALRQRDGGAFVGRAGLRHASIEGDDLVELAYALVPEHWRRGLATEIGRALLDVGFGPLGLGDIAAFTATTNLASRRVLEKLGFVHQRDFERAALPHVLYRVRRAA